MIYKKVLYILALLLCMVSVSGCTNNIEQVHEEALNLQPLEIVHEAKQIISDQENSEVSKDDEIFIINNEDAVKPTEEKVLIKENLHENPKNNLEKVKVIRIVDGDTIVVDGDVRVRFIGVDTPETVKPDSVVEIYGKEASDFTKRMIEGVYIYLERDISDVDQYGRALRYIFLEDGTLFNELLIKEGYGKVVTYPPDVKYSERFVAAQIDAREAGRGLWGLDEVKETTY
ncbi:thermonuclease family protein [Petrocella sp. FN5]|uniref:thermonuclease family protein n=1 Tax=Petrocella sp. FN5 TaxID=3032002 RepID=UPI0023D9B325|nr:thermonuclease family protein [Petrocella sp. FN5]MDF1618562.1 thermonuclease family protein [Petrocella sp. FN5]